jgi:xanthine/CO dehydrogenase XdhC/CoxF family maturation factor
MICFIIIFIKREILYVFFFTHYKLVRSFPITFTDKTFFFFNWEQYREVVVLDEHDRIVAVHFGDHRIREPLVDLLVLQPVGPPEHRVRVGLIGGRRNQEKKRERLRELGVDENAIDRISGPCGLDIGADATPEVALSILAEAVAARNGREGGPLSRSAQRIHVEVE